MTKPWPTGASLVKRRTVINGDPAQIVGPSWTSALYYFVLLGAAGVDVVTFHQVLTSAIDETEEALWVLVAGFTLVCLWLSHTAGQRAKLALGTRQVAGAQTIAWLMVAGWLMLGTTAFLFRWTHIDPADAGGTFVVDGQVVTDDTGAQDRHMAALLFLAFYVCTGLVSGAAGYIRYNADVRHYMRALAKCTKAVAKQGQLDAALKVATELSKSIRATKESLAADFTKVQAQYLAAAERLKNQTEVSLIHIAGEHAGDLRTHRQDNDKLDDPGEDKR